MKKLVDTSATISNGGRADWFNMYRESRGRFRYSPDAMKEDDIDLGAILRKYQLKGFEFGNWVGTDDRNTDIVSCERSLAHLKMVIGSPNIGINHAVGVAFGARGKSAAMAHYEPRLNMINLTKMKGAGCLAHEYGHALDANFGSFVDQSRMSAYLTGGQSLARTATKDMLGGQFRALANCIVDSIKESESYCRMRQSGEYWYRRTEVFARFFEQYVCYVLGQKGIHDGFLTNTWSYYTSQSVYLSQKDFMKILPVANSLMKEFGKALNRNGRLTPIVKATPYKKPVITWFTDQKNKKANEKTEKPKLKIAASK